MRYCSPQYNEIHHMPHILIGASGTNLLIYGDLGPGRNDSEGGSTGE